MAGSEVRGMVNWTRLNKPVGPCRGLQVERAASDRVVPPMRTKQLLGVLCVIGSACGASMTGEVSRATARSTATPTAASSAVTSSIGTNLTGISDWSAEWAFVDAFKASRDWISGSSSQWDDGRALDVDAIGLGALARCRSARAHAGVARGPLPGGPLHRALRRHRHARATAAVVARRGELDAGARRRRRRAARARSS